MIVEELAPEKISTEFLLLSDGAQVAGDKLYLLGGGWSYVRPQQYPSNVPVAMSAGVLVPWNETNREHEFEVNIRNEDTKQVLATLSGRFEQGRPAGTPQGETQRMIIAATIPLNFEAPGQYVVEISLNGELSKRVSFRALPPSTGGPGA